MRRLVATLLMAVAWAAAAQAPAAKPPARLALVIGNAAYPRTPLCPIPLNDAADIAKALEASGFTVIRRENASLREMHLALREFGDKLGKPATGLFYFAGHGAAGARAQLPPAGRCRHPARGRGRVRRAGPGRGDGEARPRARIP